ncbi:Uncharacterised protein [Brevibacterium casei]|uniref:Uncharacterized protein n=1 Tax=Brevibacterium casei TaxID=33889 RepID=A0A449DAZ6_9MICO|nr:hypothetical protein [Brevibacterium casei]VEW14733.1 Uncharacterised protein [Brevibacterium casei]
MDHDAVPSKLRGPSSHRIADVRAANERFVNHSLDVMDKKIGAESEYESNENGHFAWDISLLIRAACLMWEITADPTHLKRAERWARHVADRTDEGRHLPTWRYSRGSAWSAGKRYTAGTAVIGDVGGIPVHIQAAADQVIIEKPSDTTAIVHIVKNGGRAWSSPKTSLIPNEENYLPDVLSRRSTSFATLIRGLPAPIDLTFVAAGEYTLAKQYATHLVHTGLIARSLIVTGEALAKSRDTSASFDASSNDLLDTAQRALLVHDEEIRIRNGRAWYTTPEDFPSRRLGLELPHNHVVDAATSFLALGRTNNDEGLYHLGVSLTRRFLNEIDAYRSGQLEHPWHYYPVDSDVYFGVTRDEPMAERSISPVRRGEDSSHAVMRVRALLEWRHLNPGLVSNDQLATTALAFRRYFMSTTSGICTLKWLPEDSKDSPRRGHADTYAGAWGGLAPWDSTIKRRINSMAYRHPPKAIFGATVLSAAEILAMNANSVTYASSDRNALK